MIYSQSQDSILRPCKHPHRSTEVRRIPAGANGMRYQANGTLYLVDRSQTGTYRPRSHRTTPTLHQYLAREGRPS